MLSGLRVVIDKEVIYLSGSGTVLRPDDHDIHDVIIRDAYIEGFPQSTIDYLQDALPLIPEPPTAACYTRMEGWRILIVVVRESQAKRLLEGYIDFWVAIRGINNVDLVLFTAKDDGTGFEQVDLEFYCEEKDKA